MAISINWTTSPRIITVLAPQTEITCQELVNEVRDAEDEISPLMYPKLLNASGKESLGGGVLVGITVELQNAQIAFEQRTTSDASGTATSADAEGTTLVDTAATFITDGIQPGDTVMNTTEGSVATIITVDSETQLTSYPLDDGVYGGWEIGDSYKIWNKIQCEVTGGNLVAVDENGDELSSFFPTAFTHVIRTSSSSATLSELDAIQYSSYQNGVWIDIAGSTSGIAYPSGTREYPVNNVTDAVSIANDKGFDTLYILRSMTLGSSADLTDFIIRGRSPSNTSITIDPSAITNNITIENAFVTGTLDGGSTIRDCTIDGLTYVNGYVLNCGLSGTITLAGNEEAVFNNCYTYDQDNAPTIDMGISGQDLAMPNYSGLLTITNLNDASNEVGVGLNAGAVVLDSSVVAGTVIISGIGTLTDNSTGTTVVNTDGLMSKQTITEITWDIVWIDTVAGSSGTAFPKGTRSAPVDNLSDAHTIASALGLEHFHIHGNVTLDQSYDDYFFESHNTDSCTIDLNGQSIENCQFTRVRLTGSGSGHFNAEDCDLTAGMTTLNCHLENCIFDTGTYTAAAGETINGDRCSCPASTVFDLNGTGSINMANMSGIATITNCTDAGSTIAVTGTYLLTLHSSCTNGNALIAGIGILTDNSAGLNVTERTLPATTWDETIGAHDIANSFGKKLTDTLKLKRTKP
jgi:hypothetical protein